MASISKTVSPRTGAVSWVVRYRTPDGGSRKKSYSLKRDAQAFLTSVEASKTDGSFIDRRRSAVTVGEWSTRWLDSKTSLAKSTRSRYEDIDRKWIQPRWAAVQLGKVTHEDVQEWVASLSLQLAPASVRKVHRNLSQVFDYAVKSRRLAFNPARDIDLPHVEAAEKRYLSHEQVATLAAEVGDDWRLVVTFLAYTGLRWGELAALRVRDIDLERRRATICQAYSPVKGRMVLTDTKGHERRDVPIPRFLVDDLTEQLADKTPDGLAFTGPKGAVLRSQTLRQVAFPQASKVLGIDPPLTPHELRHTAASLAIASGADVKVVQTMLGHKSATMTLDLYGHLFADRLDVVADAMDAARGAALSSCVKIASKLESDATEATENP